MSSTDPIIVPDDEENPELTKGFTALEIDPLDLELTTDDIEDDIQAHPHKISSYDNFDEFKSALKLRYQNFSFDPDDYSTLPEIHKNIFDKMFEFIVETRFILSFGSYPRANKCT